MAAKKKVVRKKTKKKTTNKKSKKKKVVRQKTKVTKEKVVKPRIDTVAENLIYTNGTGKPDNGRMPASVDLNKVKELAKIGCTQSEIYAVLRVSKQTFITMKKNNPVLMETILQGREEGNASLRKKQIQVAMQGNPQMLIFLGKNKLNQADRAINHIELSQGETFKQALNDNEDDDDDDGLGNL